MNATLRPSRLLFAAAMIALGITGLVNGDFALVWQNVPAHIAACLGILFGIWPRLAATLEAVMVALIGIVYWAPDLQTGRTATTAFIVTLLVAAGAWVVAETYRGVRWFGTTDPASKI